MLCAGLDLAEAFQRPHVAAREMLIRDADGNLHIGDPIKFRHEPPSYTRLPALGEHTDALLKELEARRAATHERHGDDPRTSRELDARPCRLLNRPITAADRKRAALHLLDWIGCAVAGATTPPGLAMIAYAETIPSGGCRTVGGCHSRRATPR